MLRQPIVCVLGHVDHGKCVAPDTLIPLAEGRIMTAEDIFSKYLKFGKEKKIDDGIIIELKDKFPKIFSLEKNSVSKRNITHLWKLNAPEKMVEVRLKSGDRITVTPEHPFFVINKDIEIEQKKASEIKEEDFIIVPRKLEFEPKSLPEIKELIISQIKNSDNFIVFLNEKSERLFDLLSRENIINLRKKQIFTTDPYACLNNKRFRAKDFIKLCEIFGFSYSEAYDMIEHIKNSTTKRRAGHTSTKMKLPKDEEEFEKLGYILGCLAGDGYINEGILNNNDSDVHEAYMDSLRAVFDLNSDIKQGHTCQIVKTDGGKTFERFMLDIVELPSSEKSARIEVPEILQYYQPAVRQFINGMIDTDGYVSKLNNSIEILSKSKNIIKQMSIILLGYGIHSKVSEKKGYFIIRIANKYSLNKFISYFRPNLKRKLERIEKSLEKASTSRIFDITPVSGQFIRNIKISNETIPFFDKYKTYNNLSRDFIKKLINEVIDKETRRKFEFLVSDDISFMEVTSKKFIENHCEFVYDFTVPETHNFVAERIFIHNTTLLDRIRSSAVAAKEAGGITQAIGATEIPIGTIKEICGPLFERIKTKIQIPGLLFLDTPGHEAFTSLRKRGGSCADLAILVADINEGFQPQTIESISFLKEFKTPFVVAATKIDSIGGWFPNAGKPFLETIARQPQHVRDALDEKIYRIVAQLSGQGFNSERFDRISDFTKNISIVPCSGRTGEGIPELLMMLSGLAQEFLREELEIKSERGIGSVLEVKDVRGIGTTIDVILYDGKIGKGDWIVIGGREPIAAKIRALLKPAPLKELRVEKQFEHVDSVSAAIGIKISAPGLENAIAGSPIIAVKDESEIEGAKAELAKEVEGVEFEKASEGIVIKADSLGSLEAMIRMLGQRNVEIRKAGVGDVHRSDIVAIESEDRLKKAILAFNVKVSEDAAEAAKSKGVKIFGNDVIYRLLEDYEKWVSEEKKKAEREKLESITRPGKILLLKGLVFRASHPAVIGTEVLSGSVKSGVSLLKDGKEIGTIKEIQSEGQTVEKAERGQRVALSIDGAIVGRHIFEGDELFVKITAEDLKVLEELGSAEEVALAKKTLGIEQ